MISEWKMQTSRALLLGLLVLALVAAAAADEGSTEKSAADKPAEPKAEAKADAPADAKKEASDSVQLKKQHELAGEGKNKTGVQMVGNARRTEAKDDAKNTEGSTEGGKKPYSKMTPEERRAEREARMSERDRVREQKMEDRKKTKEERIEKVKQENDERRKKMGAQPHTGMHHAGRPDHMRPDHTMNEFRGTAGMFMALVAPVKPSKVTFPLDDDTRLKFSAARDGLMKSVRKNGADLDVKDEAVKKDLRAKTKRNQEKTLEILLEAVKEGMTVQEARMGMVIAQFEALDDATKQEALDKARQRQERMPSGARAKMNERLELKNKKERDQLGALKTDQEKEDFVKRIYRPRYNMATA